MIFGTSLVLEILGRIVVATVGVGVGVVADETRAVLVGPRLWLVCAQIDPRGAPLVVSEKKKQAKQRKKFSLPPLFWHRFAWKQRPRCGGWVVLNRQNRLTPVVKTETGTDIFPTQSQCQQNDSFSVSWGQIRICWTHSVMTLSNLRPTDPFPPFPIPRSTNAC